MSSPPPIPSQVPYEIATQPGFWEYVDQTLDQRLEQMSQKLISQGQGPLRITRTAHSNLRNQLALRLVPNWQRIKSQAVRNIDQQVADQQQVQRREESGGSGKRIGYRRLQEAKKRGASDIELRQLRERFKLMEHAQRNPSQPQGVPTPTPPQPPPVPKTYDTQIDPSLKKGYNELQAARIRGATQEELQSIANDYGINFGRWGATGTGSRGGTTKVSERAYAVRRAKMTGASQEQIEAIKAQIPKTYDSTGRGGGMSKSAGYKKLNEAKARGASPDEMMEIRLLYGMSTKARSEGSGQRTGYRRLQEAKKRGASDIELQQIRERWKLTEHAQRNPSQPQGVPTPTPPQPPPPTPTAVPVPTPFVSAPGMPDRVLTQIAEGLQTQSAARAGPPAPAPIAPIPPSSGGAPPIPRPGIPTGTTPGVSSAYGVSYEDWVIRELNAGRKNVTMQRFQRLGGGGRPSGTSGYQYGYGGGIGGGPEPRRPGR